MSKDGAPDRRYHHGDLRQAMIGAAEAVLAEKGVAGLTLRECARRAGVSPAAPAHHFGNLAGLMTAVATLGFDELSEAMEAAAAAASRDGTGRLEATGRAYVATAIARPGLFRVVFGRRELEWERPEFQCAAGRAFGILVRETRAHAGVADPPGPMDAATAPDLATILTMWSVTHGFSMLLIDGQLDFLAGTGGRDRLVALFNREILGLAAAAARPLANRTPRH